MRRITKACILFFLSALLILSMPAITKAEQWARYGNETNISFPSAGVNCSLGYVVYPTDQAWWCWTDFENKVMDHSFFTNESMQAYYNPGDSLIIGGETLTLSAYQEPIIETTTTPEYSFTLYDIVGYIQGLFL